MSTPTVVISGSFRKHYAEIVHAIEEFQAAGVVVLSPQISNPVNAGDDFVFLESDIANGILTPKQAEDNHLGALHRADALFIVNPEGYVGASALLEIGFAIGAGIQVYVQNPCQERLLSLYTGSGDIPGIAAKLREYKEQNHAAVDLLYQENSLSRLQAYVDTVAHLRGFAEETSRDILLLLMEEVGEVAKIIRQSTGIKTAEAQDRDTELLREKAGEELADVLSLLLDLSNSCHIDLAAAFLKKEAKNSQRTWQ